MISLKNVSRILLAAVVILMPLKIFAYTDEGPILWTSGGNILERYHSEVTRSIGATQTAIAGVDGKFIIVKASPVKKEFVMGIQDTGGTLRAYHSTNGTTWTADWTATVGDSNVARFDVAYEQSSGDAIIVYRNASNNRFSYRLWANTTSTWGAQVNQSTNYNPNSPLAAFRLASRPGTDQIGIVYLSDNFAGSAGFWNGSSWTMWNTALTTNGTRYTGFSGTFPPMRSLDIAFLSQTGTMLVMVGQNDSAKARYATRSTSGTWSAISNLSTLQGFGDFIRLEPSPTTDEVALSTCMMEPSAPQYLCESAIYSGGWGSVTTDTTTAPTVSGSIPTDVFWLIDQQNGTRAAIAEYADSSTGGIDWALSAGGNAFAIQSTNTSSPAISGSEGEILGGTIPGGQSSANIAVSDSSGNLFFKRATLSGASVSWTSATTDVQAEVTQGSNLVTSSNFGRLSFALQTNPPLLSVSSTAAVATTTIGSGNTSYVADPSCTDANTCTGILLTAHSKSDITVSSVTLTQYGSGSLANTSSWKLAVDTDGNPNNGVSQSVTGTVSGSTVTFTFGTPLTVAKGTSVQLFPQATFGNGASYPSVGQTYSLGIASTADIISASTQTPDEFIIGTPRVNAIIAPVITGYTNSTETALNYSAGCATCGARLGTGAGVQNITINGRGFGTDPGIANRATASNKIQIGATMIANANVSSWSNTSIGLTLDGSTTGNTDADFGANYGGASSLVVTAGGVAMAGLNFNLFPYVSGFTSPVTLAPSGAKVYSGADTDGVITLTGTRFGGAQGSSTVTIIGCSNTTCSSPADSVVVESWSASSVRVRVPAIIPDTTYSGNVTLVRSDATGAAASARTSTSPTLLSMRPRLMSISPTSGQPSSSVTLTGRHLCPSGGCPTGTAGTDADLNNSPAFSTSSHVNFGTTTSNYWGGWSDTQITTQVPGAAGVGTTSVQVIAGGWNAGSVSFNVLIPINAIEVTNLDQYASSALTPPLGVGAYASSTSIYFGGVVGGVGPGVKWSRLALEIEPVGTAFKCVGPGACADRFTGPWVSGGGPFDCRTLAAACAASTSTPEGSYHWQARTEFTNDSTWYYGTWTSFPISSPNAESVADFIVNRTAPVISALSVGNIDISSARVMWTTDKTADSLVQVNTSGSFTDDCSSGNGCTGQDATLVTSHASNLTSLLPGTTYYYRVKSCDVAGNCSWSGTLQFKTLSAARPAKTVFYHAMTYGGTLGSNASTTSSFSVTIPEAGTAFESIFLDIRGTEQTSGIAPAVTIDIGGAPKTYSLANTTTVTPWRLYHKVTSLNLSPGTNSIKITSGQDTTLRGVSADIVITYRYNP